MNSTTQTDTPLKIFTIKRTHSREDGVWGVLDEEGCPFSLTGELPWKDNKPSVSCIPVGEYMCKRVQSPRFGDTFEITGIPGRSNVLFHWGNVPLKDSEGCILVAESFGVANGSLAVLGSRNRPGDGFLELLQRTVGLDQFRLIIKEV